MRIVFNRLTLQNFKNHKALEVLFKDITTITGRNGAGKSSIGEAVTWTLYGVDTMGTKLEPTPIGTTEDTKVELLLTVDDKQVLLGRAIEKGKAKYYVNEVPSKATEYTELVESLFDKNLFLSLFTPGYFSSQHWEEQRKQLLRYVSEPANVEVLDQMSKMDRERLEGLLKKHTLSDIEKIHRDNFNKMDKDFIRAQERAKTLQEQLEKASGEEASSIDREQTEAEIERLEAELAGHKQKAQEQRTLENKRTTLLAKLNSVKSQLLEKKKQFEDAKAQPIEDTCQACGQALQEESLQKVQESRTANLQSIADAGKLLLQQTKDLEAELKELPEPVELEDASDLQQRIFSLKALLEADGRTERLQAEIEEAKKQAEEIRKSRNQSLSIVDSVKEFKAQQTALMVKKVQELFFTISVQLFKEQKNGELKPTFEIEMDGKPYSKLSTAEKIRCGLEVIEVLSRQSDVTAPTFVDNAESILRFTQPVGQLIMARVADTDFTITAQKVEEEMANV